MKSKLCEYGCVQNEALMIPFTCKRLENYDHPRL